MADTVNEIAKWLDESVPDKARDTDAARGEEAGEVTGAGEGTGSGQVTGSVDGSAPTDVFDDSGDSEQPREAAPTGPLAELQLQTDHASPAHNPTILIEDVLDGPSRSFAERRSETEEIPPSPAGEGSITEYNSAVNYISDLIEQLRVPDGAKPVVPAQHHDNDKFNVEQTCVLGHDDLDVLGIGNTIPVDPRLVASSKSPNFSETPPPLDENESEQGYAYRRSMLHSLREAAHLATNTSLELNDCSRYAHRAYYAGFFGCASAFFSIVFVLMSPKAGTFGFAASVGAFSVAFCLSLVYGISYRAFLRKAVRVRGTRAGTAGENLSPS